MAETLNAISLGKDSMRIEGFRFGEVRISGTPYTDDLILFEDRVRPHWWRKDGDEVRVGDLAEAFAEGPDTLIIGTGAHQCLKIAPEVIAYAMKAGIELLAFDTRTACQTFNRLRGKRRVVAALHLTC